MGILNSYKEENELNNQEESAGNSENEPEPASYHCQAYVLV